MHTFQITVLIQFTAFPSTCSAVYVNACKTYHKKTAFKNGLPDDEHMMFETCRRHQELNSNISFKSVHFVGVRYRILSHGTVQYLYLCRSA
jgi:hypothetical protein